MWYIQREDEYLRSESLWTDQVTYFKRLRKKHLLRLATVKRSGLSGLDFASFKRFQGDSTRISTGKAVLILRQISISFDLLSIDY